VGLTSEQDEATAGLGEDLDVPFFVRVVVEVINRGRE
jgi:hypothetical protein